jgi:HEAT repeat protein
VACDPDNSKKVRERALLALQVIPDPTVEEDIYEMIMGQNTLWKIERRAMNVLGAIGTPQSTKYLQEISQSAQTQRKVIHASRLLETTSPGDIREDAAETLEEIYDNFQEPGWDY